jgi:hypothetical protein
VGEMPPKRRGRHTPGAKAPLSWWGKRPKAKALGYLEARQRQKRNTGVLPHSTTLRVRMTAIGGGWAHAVGYDQGVGVPFVVGLFSWQACVSFVALCHRWRELFELVVACGHALIH